MIWTQDGVSLASNTFSYSSQAAARDLQLCPGAIVFGAFPQQLKAFFLKGKVYKQGFSDFPLPEAHSEAKIFQIAFSLLHEPSWRPGKKSLRRTVHVVFVAPCNWGFYTLMLFHIQHLAIH